MEISDYKYVRHKVGGENVLYQIAHADRAGSDLYFGYINNEGGWLIQKTTEVASVTTYLYAVGASGYANAWTGRAGLVCVAWDALGGKI